MKIKTSELSGHALDWAVAAARGFLDPLPDEPRPRVVMLKWDEFFPAWNPRDYGRHGSIPFEPSTDWQTMGPIIEEELISVSTGSPVGEFLWNAIMCVGEDAYEEAYGPTALIAAMRCFVASKLGDEVEIPEELK